MSSGSPAKILNWSAPWYAKAIGVLALYVMWGHPTVFEDMWRGEKWVLLAGVTILFPIVSVACLRLLITKLTVTADHLALRGILGTTRIPLKSITEVERVYGAALLNRPMGD